VASQQAAIFFEPRIGRSLLGAFAGAISGPAITRGTSFLKDAMGQKIFSDAITITDDPLRKRGLASHAWDAEGIAARKRALIENGILTTWLLDARSARQLGMQPTGHTTRGLAGTPHPSATNLYIENGALSPQQMLQQFGTGFLVTETIGHGTNLLTGDFSVGASGFWVENGEPAYPVSEVTIAGNLKDMFATMIAANDLEFRYSTNAPTLVVPRMTIAGN
jgi:PmbA protein